MRLARHNAGFSLLECLVYIAILAMVLFLAYGALFRCLANERSLHRNADDIARALHAGERWRADIRAAVAPPRLLENALHIPGRTNEIVYTLADGVVWRRTGPQSATPVLRQVKSSRIEQDLRTQFTAWRWELELTSAQAAPRVRPLFTFEAMAGGQP